MDNTIHTIQIPPAVWQWAQDCTGQKAPATFLRNILLEACIAANGNGNTKAQQPQAKPRGPNARQAIIDVLHGKDFYSRACDAILNSGWDYTDPAGLMRKPAEEVLDFLQCCSYEVGYFEDLAESRAKLLKMIFDAYLRSTRSYI